MFQISGFGHFKLYTKPQGMVQVVEIFREDTVMVVLQNL